MSAGREPEPLTPARIVLILAGLAVLSAISYYRLRPEPEEKGKLIEFSGRTMGTTYSVKVYADSADDVASLQLKLLTLGLLGDLDLKMSTYKAESELSRFNASASTEAIGASRPLIEVFSAALAVSEETGGAFDITVGPIVNAYGFGPEARVDPPTESELAALRMRVGYTMLSVDEDALTLRKSRPDIYADLSAIAKGYAVDVLVQTLERAGAKNYFAEIGGEVRTKGRNKDGEPWRVGIEEPSEGRRVIHRIVGLEDYAMATSGDYRNYYEEDGRRISHTIDPRSGLPVSHNLASATVFHEQCMMADAYATAMMVLGVDEGHRLAEELKLAVIFLVREDDGTFSERTTSAFDDRFGP